MHNALTKARLVTRGDNQRPGIDYDQVFAPTTRLGALRSVLALAALAGDHIESIDLLNAYPNGELEKEYDVYMHQPEGFKQYGPNGEQLVCRLIKGLYGLKQSGRLWYHKLAETLEAMGFTQTRLDPSIYVWICDGTHIILPVFIDDITIVSKDADKIAYVKDALRKIFKIKDLGKLLSSRSKNSISEMTNGLEYVSPVRSPEMIGNRKGFGVRGTWLQLMCCAVSHRRVPNFESQGFDRR